MGVFNAVFGRRGDAGFSGALLGVSSGVVGFNVTMFLRPVCEICRPARPHVGASAKKFAPQAQDGQNMLFSGAPGEYFRGNAAGGIPLGEFFSRTSSRGIPPGECVAPCTWRSGPSTGTLNPLMHSCTHLVEAGRRRPRSTRWVNVRIGGPRHPLAGPRPPPIGLACE